MGVMGVWGQANGVMAFFFVGVPVGLGWSGGAGAGGQKERFVGPGFVLFLLFLLPPAVPRGSVVGGRPTPFAECEGVVSLDLDEI